MKQAKLKKSQRKNLMKVKQIIKQDHVISYDYEISGDWKKYFTENRLPEHIAVGGRGGRKAADFTEVLRRIP